MDHGALRERRTRDLEENPRDRPQKGMPGRHMGAGRGVNRRWLPGGLISLTEEFDPTSRAIYELTKVVRGINMRHSVYMADTYLDGVTAGKRLGVVAMACVYSSPVSHDQSAHQATTCLRVTNPYLLYLP
jgi:hypothetical protein